MYTLRDLGPDVLDAPFETAHGHGFRWFANRWLAPPLNSRGESLKHEMSPEGTGDTMYIIRHDRKTPVCAYPGGEQFAINGVGHVAGWTNVSPGSMPGYFFGLSNRRFKTGAQVHAILFKRNKCRDLGTLAGGKGDSYAFALNNLDEVVGQADTASGLAHAFVSRDGRMHDLGTLGGDFSSATAISDSGVVVGWAETTEIAELRPGGAPTFDAIYLAPRMGFKQIRHAFEFSGGRMRDLTPVSRYGSAAHDINRNGWVVGSMGFSHGTGFLYAHGKTYDLNQLVRLRNGVRLSAAGRIDDNNQILAFGMVRGDRRRHTFLLVPLDSRTAAAQATVETSGTSRRYRRLKS